MTNRVHHLLAWWFLGLGIGPLHAHIGSQNVYYEGLAGPYALRVIVRPAEVVPGKAEAVIEVKSGSAQKIELRPIRSDTREAGRPAPEFAESVADSPHFFAANVWFMLRGSYDLEVSIEGDQGIGVVHVPVQIIAQEGQQMGWPMELLGAFFGFILFAVGAYLVRKGISEATLIAGGKPSQYLLRRANLGMVSYIVVVVAILLIGKVWWDRDEAYYKSKIFKGLKVSTNVSDDRVLRLSIDDEDWKSRLNKPFGGFADNSIWADWSWTPLIPDHGKWMHMFLIKEGTLDVFAHVHPKKIDDSHFAVVIPDELPAGKYLVYADVTHENGFAHTITDVVTIESVDLGKMAKRTIVNDLDDSWFVSKTDGFVLVWNKPAKIKANELISLRFDVYSEDGSPAQLEPYMDMLGHAAIRRNDGSVFSHVHPVGNISMAAQRLYEKSEKGCHDEHEQNVNFVTFPYAFVRAGSYRVWIQVKTAGRVLTGIFDVDVES